MKKPRHEFEDEATAVFTAADLKRSVIPLAARHVLVRMDGADVGKVVGLNPQAEFIIGRRPECDLQLNYEGVSRRHARVLFDGRQYFVEDLKSSNGTRIRGESITRHRLKDGDVLRFGPTVSVRYSVTDSKEEDLLRKMHNSAVRDSLTGAYNREYLDEHMRAELAYSARHHTPTSLIMFDLDHFKQVNDVFGHQAGDAVLIDIVKNVDARLRGEDALARYGGEEFAISLRGLTLDQTQGLAQAICEGNNRTIRFAQHDIAVSISVGCAAISDCSAPSPEALIAVADRRLYAAKHAGRNQVVAAG